MAGYIGKGEGSADWGLQGVVQVGLSIGRWAPITTMTIHMTIHIYTMVGINHYPKNTSNEKDMGEIEI